MLFKCRKGTQNKLEVTEKWSLVGAGLKEQRQMKDGVRKSNAKLVEYM